MQPIREQVRLAVERACDRAVAGGALPSWPDGADRPRVEVERPADAVHGDFASNLAMRLARPYRMAPLSIAAALAAELDAESEGEPGATPVRAAEVAPPGFLNMRLRDAPLESAIEAILADPAGWGRVKPVRPGSVNVEFVSANPTGPLHVGHWLGNIQNMLRLQADHDDVFFFIDRHSSRLPGPETGTNQPGDCRRG
jgi:arginyl-tRNA synthetase